MILKTMRLDILRAVTTSGLVALLRIYQGVSAVLPGQCRFAPTCSHYAVTALKRHGLLRGSLLAVRRLARCHPLGDWGHDPVPPARTSRRPDNTAHASGANLEETK